MWLTDVIGDVSLQRSSKDLAAVTPERRARRAGSVRDDLTCHQRNVSVGSVRAFQPQLPRLPQSGRLRL
jgi:hypothetical protein